MTDNIKQQDFLEELEQYAVLEERGFRAYRRQYALENRPPRKPPWYAGLPWMMVPFAGIALAGSLLSASRTWPVFREIAGLTVTSEVAASAEGFLAMVAVDLSVVAFRFIRVYLDYQGRETEAQITRWVRFGFWVAFFTQLTAQAYATRGIAPILEGYSDAFQVAIAFAAAISGMVLAFITGEILAALFVRSQSARREMQQQYREAWDAWYDGLRRSWAKNREKYIGRRPGEHMRTSRERSRTENSPERRANSPTGRENPTNAEWKVIEFLRTNPDAANWSRKDLAEAVGVAKSTASTGARWLEYRPELANNNHNGQVDQGG